MITMIKAELKRLSYSKKILIIFIIAAVCLLLSVGMFTYQNTYDDVEAGYDYIEYSQNYIHYLEGKLNDNLSERKREHILLGIKLEEFKANNNVNSVITKPTELPYMLTIDYLTIIFILFFGISCFLSLFFWQMHNKYFFHCAKFQGIKRRDFFLGKNLVGISFILLIVVLNIIIEEIVLSKFDNQLIVTNYVKMKCYIISLKEYIMCKIITLSLLSVFIYFLTSCLSTYLKNFRLTLVSVVCLVIVLYLITNVIHARLGGTNCSLIYYPIFGALRLSDYGFTSELFAAWTFYAILSIVCFVLSFSKFRKYDF